MGNQPSGTSAATSSSSTHMTAEDRLRPLVAPFVRQTGSLGLSRQELDKRCQPSGYVMFLSYFVSVLYVVVVVVVSIFFSCLPSR